MPYVKGNKCLYSSTAHLGGPDLLRQTKHDWLALPGGYTVPDDDHQVLFWLCNLWKVYIEQHSNSLRRSVLFSSLNLLHSAHWPRCVLRKLKKNPICLYFIRKGTVFLITWEIGSYVIIYIFKDVTTHNNTLNCIL